MLENRPASVNAPLLVRSRDAEVPSRQRARRTNDPLAAISTNTARGRRVADLVRAYLRALGNPANIEQQAAVIAAAELQVLAEEARAAALKKAGHADLDQVIRVQGAADRAVRRLGLDQGAREPARETFADIAARAQAEADRRRALELAADEPAETPTSTPVLMESAPASAAGASVGKLAEDWR